MESIIIKQCTISEIDLLTTLGIKLWPNHTFEDLKEEFTDIILETDKNAYFIAYESDLSHPIGFLHVSIRIDYIEGASTSPNGFLEGIYVLESYRKCGVATSLLDEAILWVKDKGCSAIGSDCELNNEISREFHERIGFKEMNRVICFLKEI